MRSSTRSTTPATAAPPSRCRCRGGRAGVARGARRVPGRAALRCARGTPARTGRAMVASRVALAVRAWMTAPPLPRRPGLWRRRRCLPVRAGGRAGAGGNADGGRGRGHISLTCRHTDDRRRDEPRPQDLRPEGPARRARRIREGSEPPAAAQRPRAQHHRERRCGSTPRIPPATKRSAASIRSSSETRRNRYVRQPYFDRLLGKPLPPPGFRARTMGYAPVHRRPFVGARRPHEHSAFPHRQRQAVSASVDPRTLLVQFIREQLQLTGTQTSAATRRSAARAPCTSTDAP